MINIKTYYKGLIFIVLSAMGFGIMPIFAKFAYESGISAVSLLSLRFIFSGIILFIYLGASGISLKVTKKDVFYLFLLGGVFYSATSIFYFSSIKYIPPSLTVLLMYTHPMMVVILSTVFNKEKLIFQMILSMVVAFVGLILILGESIVTKLNGLGILLAVASAISYSIYIFVSSRVIKKVSSIVATAYISIFAALGMVGIGLFQGDSKWSFGVIPWLPLAGLVFISTIFAILFFLRGVEILGPTKSTIISMLEPVFTVVLSLLIFNEVLTVLQFVGGVAVLIGAIMMIIMKGEVTEISKDAEVILEIENQREIV